VVSTFFNASPELLLEDDGEEDELRLVDADDDAEEAEDDGTEVAEDTADEAPARTPLPEVVVLHAATPASARAAAEATSSSDVFTSGLPRSGRRRTTSREANRILTSWA
jgi:hypothetical protein